MTPAPPRALARLLHFLGRIRVRLLAVNLVVVLVPIIGLEFARVYERQLLDGLERDMVNQATLVRVMLETQLDLDDELSPPVMERLLQRAAQRTRTRIRLILPERGVIADSHHDGPPEGPELSAPILARSRLQLSDSVRMAGAASGEAPIPQRHEVLTALGGSRATATRYAVDPPAVFLFLAEPVRHAGEVVSAVYVTRSTNPVLVEMHSVRRGLIKILIVTLGLTAIVTLALSLSISRPLERLSRAARRITRGDLGVPVPLGGGGEISELAAEFDQMTRQLEARQRYISEFAADVAHELKSPLTSIRGAAELLAEGADDDLDARRRFLNNIRLDATRLDRLVSRLLELSRIDASEQLPQVVDLKALVTRAVARSEGPEAPIELRYEATLSSVMAREADLETALLNLLDNAQRFSPEGAAVSVLVTGPSEDDLFTIRVVDRGPGILPEHVPRVFDRFFTTDAERDGTGLGLAIVKSVASAHGGQISFTSEPGCTCFSLQLPTGFRRERRARA
ncbi:MAG TPA: ATP-binding protein [Polyangiaceae bacterium]|nr:ATP-binding protein [Polyangiaceae bacterium]